MKGIVIGLMNRLASYAAQESESQSSEVKQEKELAAASKLLETLSLSKENPPPPSPPTTTTSFTTTEEAPAKKDSETETSTEPPAEQNGTKPEPSEPADNKDEGYAESVKTTNDKSLLSSIKLYEIFYDQVLNLVNVDLPYSIHAIRTDM